ncbi:hypothetical protein H4R20_000337 [Coemansia guatemalensis]|uniref:Uncharacterized protein n=1 Tax=Coemansia guatemalensis TaxID=2761395 RepID=A0A9W8HZF7_9FUNG|nr:hypothetical protein H4R20_000337 [Coemansia guatemalensis]
MAVSQTAARNGVRRSSKSSAKQACPKCANRIEQFSVDTNCTFRMCSNTSCAWPFDSGDMESCFEHDATVPSIRKRAKRRKAQATREERRIKRRQSEAQQHGQMGATSTGSIQTPDPLSPNTVDLQPTSNAALTDWLTGLCGNSSADTGLLPIQGKYKQSGATSNEVLPANWLETLLAGPSDTSKDVKQSNDYHNGLTAFSELSATGDSITQTSNGPVDPNVADFFAAFNSVSSATTAPVQDDAVIPHNTRHPSPATSESDEVDSRTLSPGELDLLISGKPSLSQNPPPMVSAVGSGSSYLDSLTMLLSPPESASTGASLASAKQQGTDSTLDLLGSQPWSAQSDTTVTGKHGLLDLNDLLASTAAPTQLSVATAPLSGDSHTKRGFATDVDSPLDANSIIENIFGSSSKLTPNVL